MSRQRENKDSIRRYLLGEMSEQERERIEQRLLSDDDFYQQLLINEDDLVDEFVADALPEQERVKFSQRFLQVPQLRQDVKFAMALRKHVLEAAPQAPVAVTPRVSLLDWLRKLFMQPVLGISLTVALLALVLLAVWLAAQNSRLRKQVEQLQATQTPTPISRQDLEEQLAAERLRSEKLSDELREQERRMEEARKIQETKEESPPPTRKDPPLRNAAVVAFTLTPGLVRESGSLKKLSVPPGTSELLIRLDLAEGDYQSYRVVLKTLDGRELLSRQGLRAASGGKYVPVSIPAQLISPNDYQILLLGVTPSGEAEDISSYYFRVLK